MQNVTQKRQENVEKKSKLKSTNKKNLVPFADGVLNEMPSRGVMKDIPNYSGVKSSNSMGSTSSGDQSKYSSNSHISSNSTNKRSIISISARYPHFDNCTFDENKLSVGHIREGYQCDKSHYENLPSSLSHKSHSNITDYFDKIVKGGISSNNKFNCTNNRQSQGNARPTDNIWLVTPRTKTLTEQWFRDLSDGKELRLLRKRIPIFNKVDELFITLYENRILASRAVWLLKVTHQYSEKSDSGKSKKRQSYLLNDVVGIFSNNLFCSDYKSNGFFHYILDILDALHSNAMINDLDFLKLIIDMIQNRKFNTNVSMILRITIIISKSVAIISKHYHLYINVFIYFMKALRSNHWLKMSEKNESTKLLRSLMTISLIDMMMIDLEENLQYLPKLINDDVQCINVEHIEEIVNHFQSESISPINAILLIDYLKKCKKLKQTQNFLKQSNECEQIDHSFIFSLLKTSHRLLMPQITIQDSEANLLIIDDILLTNVSRLAFLEEKLSFIQQFIEVLILWSIDKKRRFLKERCSVIAQIISRAIESLQNEFVSVTSITDKTNCFPGSALLRRFMVNVVKFYCKSFHSKNVINIGVLCEELVCQKVLSIQECFNHSIVSKLLERISAFDLNLCKILRRQKYIPNSPLTASHDSTLFLGEKLAFLADNFSSLERCEYSSNISPKIPAIDNKNKINFKKQFNINNVNNLLNKIRNSKDRFIKTTYFKYIVDYLERKLYENSEDFDKISLYSLISNLLDSLQQNFLNSQSQNILKRIIKDLTCILADIGPSFIALLNRYSKLSDLTAVYSDQIDASSVMPQSKIQKLSDNDDDDNLIASSSSQSSDVFPRLLKIECPFDHISSISDLVHPFDGFEIWLEFLEFYISYGSLNCDKFPEFSPTILAGIEDEALESRIFNMTAILIAFNIISVKNLFKNVLVSTFLWYFNNFKNCSVSDENGMTKNAKILGRTCRFLKFCLPEQISKDRNLEIRSDYFFQYSRNFFNSMPLYPIIALLKILTLIISTFTKEQIKCNEQAKLANDLFTRLCYLKFLKDEILSSKKSLNSKCFFNDQLLDKNQSLNLLLQILINIPTKVPMHSYFNEYFRNSNVSDLYLLSILLEYVMTEYTKLYSQILTSLFPKRDQSAQNSQNRLHHNSNIPFNHKVMSCICLLNILDKDLDNNIPLILPVANNRDSNCSGRFLDSEALKVLISTSLDFKSDLQVKTMSLFENRKINCQELCLIDLLAELPKQISQLRIQKYAEMFKKIADKKSLSYPSKVAKSNLNAKNNQISNRIHIILKNIFVLEVLLRIDNSDSLLLELLLLFYNELIVELSHQNNVKSNQNNMVYEAIHLHKLFCSEILIQSLESLFNLHCSMNFPISPIFYSFSQQKEFSDRFMSVSENNVWNIIEAFSFNETLVLCPDLIVGTAFYFQLSLEIQSFPTNLRKYFNPNLILHQPCDVPERSDSKKEIKYASQKTKAEENAYLDKINATNLNYYASDIVVDRLGERMAPKQMTEMSRFVPPNTFIPSFQHNPQYLARNQDQQSIITNNNNNFATINQLKDSQFQVSNQPKQQHMYHLPLIKNNDQMNAVQNRQLHMHKAAEMVAFPSVEPAGNAQPNNFLSYYPNNDNNEQNISNANMTRFFINQNVPLQMSPQINIAANFNQIGSYEQNFTSDFYPQNQKLAANHQTQMTPFYHNNNIPNNNDIGNSTSVESNPFYQSISSSSESHNFHRNQNPTYRKF